MRDTVDRHLRCRYSVGCKQELVGFSVFFIRRADLVQAVESYHM